MSRRIAHAAAAVARLESTLIANFISVLQTPAAFHVNRDVLTFPQ
jgi:hypothetical protein